MELKRRKLRKEFSHFGEAKIGSFVFINIQQRKKNIIKQL